MVAAQPERPQLRPLRFLSELSREFTAPAYGHMKPITPKIRRPLGGRRPRYARLSMSAAAQPLAALRYFGGSPSVASEESLNKIEVRP